MDYSNTTYIDKIYRGSYEYLSNNSIYSEETFEVFRNNKELSLTFISELVSRMSTGELLTINTSFEVGKDWIPRKVAIKKTLGSEWSTEIYDCDPRSNIINYSFCNKIEEIENRISTPPKFHIATPTSVSSMLFLPSKKFEANSPKNNYTIFTSNNKWKYTEGLKSKNISMEKLPDDGETIELDGNVLQGDYYKFYESSNDEFKKNLRKKIVEPPSISIFISKHSSIPYFIEEDDGTQIKIKFLTDFDSF